MLHSNDGWGISGDFLPAIDRTLLREPQCFVLRYMPKAERLVELMLGHVGMDYTNLTFQRRLPRHRGIVRRSWFPGYLFCHFDLLADRWQQLRRIPGVLDMLGGPTALRQDVFTDLRARCPAGLMANDALTVIPAGSEVEILAGPFVNMTGIVATSRNDTVWVEVFIFNQPTRTELRARDVKVIG